MPHPGSPSARPVRLGATTALALLLLLPTAALLGLAAPGASTSPTATPTPAAATELALARASLERPASHPGTAASPSTPWVNLTGFLTTSPGAREGAAMAYVPESGAVILFGGLAHNRSLADTWEFRNGTWTDLTPNLTISPPARYKAIFEEDPADHGALLFGGNAGTLYRNDTWLWNGSAWSRLVTASAPSAREDAAAAYDAADGYLMLFGGEAFAGNFLNDTWAFQNGSWSNLTALVGAAPPAREAGAAAFDAVDGYVLLFSGKGTSSNLLNDTWTYKAGHWTNLTATLALAPPGRESLNMVYDSVDGYVLLYGGFHYPNSLSDEWRFTGGAWSSLTLSATPPPREDAAMAYDPAPTLPYVVLFGGRTTPLANGTLLNDTWSYKRPIEITLAGTSPIDLGETTTLAAVATGGYAPLNLSWTGLPPGCTGGNASSVACTPTASGSYAVTVGAVDVGGFTATSPTLSLVVNPDPSASAVASVTTGPAPLSVTFNATIAGGTAPFSYRWSFGDGANATILDPTHAYLPGVYNAVFVVTDARGLSATASVGPITATAPSIPLSVVATADVSAGVAPLTVRFGAVATGGAPPYQFLWTLSGGTTSTSENTSYTYTSPGTYTAIVVVTDAISEQNLSSVSVTVSAPPALHASASATPATGTAPLHVAFSGSASGGVPPYTYSWSFGVAGASSTTASSAYTYTSAGTFDATLTVTDAASTTATTTVQVVVAAPLSASFSAVAGAPYCLSGSGVAFVNVSANASGGAGGYTYAWSFPYGVTGPAPGSASGSTLVPAGATYAIGLTVVDTAGTTVQSTENVTAASISCATASGGGSSTPWLIYALVGIVAAAVAVEAVLLLRRQRRA